MANFNYSRMFKIKLSKEDVYTINSLTQTYNYYRLYKEAEEFEAEMKAKEIKDTATKKNTHFTDALNIYIKIDSIKDNLLKNQLALGLINQILIETPGKQNGCDLKLNAMLMYELYITLAENICIANDAIAKKSKITSEGRHKEISELKSNIEKYKAIITSISTELKIEDIYILALDYKKEDVLSHMDKCLIEME